MVRQARRYLADGSLFWHVLTSGRRVLGGFLLAAAVAVPLGIVLGTSRTAKALFDPILSIIRPLPSLSWIPLTILWFGIDEGQKYAIVFMGTFASALLYVMESTRRVDPLLIKAAQNLGATRVDVLREVILPGSLPGIISGLKVCLALAWTCVLSAEMVAATHGLGALIWFAKDWNNMALVMVGMVSISITVLVIDSAFRLIEDRILPVGAPPAAPRRLTRGREHHRCRQGDQGLRGGPPGPGGRPEGPEPRGDRRRVRLPRRRLGLRQDDVPEPGGGLPPADGGRDLSSGPGRSPASSRAPA